jgi:hypothetical protein
MYKFTFSSDNFPLLDKSNHDDMLVYIKLRTHVPLSYCHEQTGSVTNERRGLGLVTGLVTEVSSPCCEYIFHHHHHLHESPL